jgi:hypothetical protein
MYHLTILNNSVFLFFCFVFAARRLLQLSSVLKKSLIPVSSPALNNPSRNLCGQASQTCIDVTPKVSLFDQDIKVKVRGLASNVKVTIQACVHHEWRKKPIVFASYGHFVSGKMGEVDLQRDSSLGVTFTGV